MRKLKTSLALFFFLAVTTVPTLSNNFQQASSNPIETLVKIPKNDSERETKMREVLGKTQKGRDILETLNKENTQIVYEDMPEGLKGYYIHGNQTIYLNRTLPSDFDDLIISNEVAHVRQMTNIKWHNMQMPNEFIVTNVLFEAGSFVENMDYLYAAQQQERDLSAYLDTTPVGKELFSIYSTTMEATNGDKNKAAHALVQHWITSPSAQLYLDICFDNLDRLMSHREYFIQNYNLDKRWDSSALPIDTMYDYLNAHEINAWYKQLTSAKDIKFKLTSIQSRIDLMEMSSKEEKISQTSVDNSPPPP